MIDLDYALSFVEDSGNFQNLPIGLFEHSWGAYFDSSVLTYRGELKPFSPRSRFAPSKIVRKTSRPGR